MFTFGRHKFNVKTTVTFTVFSVTFTVLYHFRSCYNPLLLFGIIRPRLLWERIENRLNMQWLALLISLGHRMTSRECQRESKAQTAKTFVFYPASKRF